MERLEEDYYSKTQEGRQTNAIKYMSEFKRRPFAVFERVNQHLQLAYLGRVEPRQAARYKRLVGEIVGILREFPEEELNRPLEDIYLMGYELQRNAFFTKMIRTTIRRRNNYGSFGKQNRLCGADLCDQRQL